MNTLQSTLQTGRQFVVQLPDGMPIPEFDYFQPVQWEDYRGTATGRIIGLYWIDDNTALMEQGRTTPGWHYMVSRIFGVTDTHKLLASDITLEMLPESDLTAIEGAAS